MASSNGPKGPSLYNPAAAAEIAAINASMTQASSKQRPGRGLSGRGSGAMARGFGRRLSPTRPTPAADGARVSSCSNSVDNHVVSSRTSQAPAHGANTSVARHPSHASPTSGSDPWGQDYLNIEHVTPNMIADQTDLGGRAPDPAFQAVAASTQAATTIFGSSATPQTQYFGSASIGVDDLAGDASCSTPLTVFPMAPPPVPAFPTANDQLNGLKPAATCTRQPIVTNWGPNPVGPVIPAHLRQTSAASCIAEISQMTGIPFEELTSDGLSIPAGPHPKDPSQSQRTPSGDVVWMAAKSGRRHTSSEMDVDTDDDATINANQPPQALGNLSDSRWAESQASRNFQESSYTESKWGLPVKKPAPTKHASATTFTMGASIFKTENSRTVVIGGLKDSAFATTSFGAPIHQVGPLQTVSNGCSSSQTSVLAPALSASHAHYGSTNKNIRQTSNHFPAQGLFDSQNAAPPSNSLAGVSNLYANTASSGHFSFDAPAKPFARTTTAASTSIKASANPATVAKSGEKQKTLKDSIWA